MEEGLEQLEDGEVLESCDTSINTNHFTQSRATREPQVICSEESSNDNSEKSDEDSDAQCSRPKKTKSQCRLPEKKKEVPNKYMVWSSQLQEEALMENLNKCDVDSPVRERSVESYNYKRADKTDYSQFSRYHMPVSECHYLESDYVMCNDEKQNVIGSKRRQYRKEAKYKRFRPRGLPSLTVTSENSTEEVAEDIAIKLRESKVQLIMNIVLVLGKEKAIALYNETKGVEDNGGMLLMNEERRRTPGGVYFLLVKRDNSIASNEMKQIFHQDTAQYKSRRRLKAKRKRQKNLEEFKETLIREKLLCLNTTASNQESEVKPSEVLQDSESNNLEEGELTVSNPPPSPATDQDISPARNTAVLSDEETVARPTACTRPVVSYDNEDDFLEVDIVDDIDMF